MKITGVRTLMAGVPRQNWLFVIIDTDTGLSGVGEASLEGKERTVETAVKEMAPHLIGKDPTRIEFHWQVLYRHGFWRGGVVLNTALSGIEQALWDITGKELGVPVYRLLGGACRDRVRLYGHCGGPTPEASAQNATEMVAKGFTALKMGSWNPAEYISERHLVDNAMARVKAVREAVGDEVDLMVDNHGRLTPGLAIQMMRALEPYKLLFFEEPVPPDNVDAMAKVAAAGINMHIATGERLFTKWGFRDLLEKQIADIIQPDVCHAGGVLETRHIAAMAEAYYVRVAPHNPNGPVATAASVQLAACTPNFEILEYAESQPWRNEVLKEPMPVVNGCIELPTRPGLGVELNEEAVRRYPYQPRPYGGAFHSDGAVADI